jgi:hypothetical protein
VHRLRGHANPAQVAVEATQLKVFDRNLQPRRCALYQPVSPSRVGVDLANVKRGELVERLCAEQPYECRVAGDEAALRRRAVDRSRKPGDNLAENLWLLAAPRAGTSARDAARTPARLSSSRG